MSDKYDNKYVLNKNKKTVFSIFLSIIVAYGGFQINAKKSMTSKVYSKFVSNKRTIFSIFLPILAIYSGYRFYLRDTHTWVEDIPVEELDNVLEEEIRKFTSIKGQNGKTVFRVSNNFQTFDRYVQLLVVRTVNDMLDLLPNFKNKLIAKYSNLSYLNGFKLGSSDDLTDFPIQTMGVPVCALTSYNNENDGIYINKLFGNHLNLSKFLGKTFVKFGFNCPLISTQIIQGAIRHELGHLFSFLNNIKNISINSPVSRYGASDSDENYAECFANLFSGKPTEDIQTTFLAHIREFEPNLTMEKIQEKNKFVYNPSSRCNSKDS